MRILLLVAQLLLASSLFAQTTVYVRNSTWQDFDANDVIGNTQHPDHLAAMQELMYIDQFNPGLVHLDDYLKNLIQ